MKTHAFHCRACDETFEFELGALPKAVPCPSCGQTKTKKSSAAPGATGTYRFSPALGATVRVSARVPGLKKGGSPDPGPRPGPGCPPEGCGACR